MAKRTAERQLTKDDGEEILEDDEGQRGIKLADKATLAARPMRGLPKRLGGSSSSTNVGSKPQAEPTSKFPSFTGFGTGSSSTFNFTPPASPGSSLNNSPAPKFDASWKSTPLTPPSFSSPPPTRTSQILAASPTIAEPTGPSPSAKAYFMSLRGLNNSFVKAINTALDDDPFKDLSANFFETYKKYLAIIDSQRKTAEAEEARAKAPVTTFTKGFGVASSSPPKANAQTATSSKQSPFSFPPTAASDTSKAFNFSSKPAASSNSGFSFPPSSGTNSNLAPSPFGSAAPAAAATPSPFTPAPSAATTSLFGSSSSSPFGAPPTSKPSTSLFGAPPTSDATTSSSSKLTFGNSEPAASEKASPFGAPTGSSSTFTFGGPAKEPSSSSSFGASAGGSPLSFGAKKDTPSTTEPVPNFFSTPPAASGGGPLSKFGGFGKPSTPGGSIGNPVGFGFGAAEEAAKKAADEKAAGEKAGAEDEIEMTPTEPSSSQELVKEKSGLNFDTPHDVEGEGEEDESTTYSLKIKAYRLKKGESAGWADLGTGVLRLKKHVTTDARRVLMRNSASGKININFRLYAGFKPTVSKKALTFMGHDETGAATTYSVRTKTEDQAGQLKDALEREIAFVKAKEAGA